MYRSSSQPEYYKLEAIGPMSGDCIIIERPIHPEVIAEMNQELACDVAASTEMTQELRAMLELLRDFDLVSAHEVKSYSLVLDVLEDRMLEVVDELEVLV